MAHLLYCALVLLLPFITVAQDSTIALRRTARVILKFAPLSLPDPDATVQGAVEAWLKRRHSIQAEFGYGPDRLRLGGFGPSPWTPNNSLNGKEVWRTRLEGRYYPSPFGKNSRSGPYIAVEGVYKRVNVAQLDTLLAGETTDPMFVYSPVTRHVFALHGKIGTQFLLGYYSKAILSRLVVDVYAGPGIRHISVSSKSTETIQLFEDKAIYERFAYSEYRPGDSSWRLSISVGLKIGVSL